MLGKTALGLSLRPDRNFWGSVGVIGHHLSFFFRHCHHWQAISNFRAVIKDVSELPWYLPASHGSWAPLQRTGSWLITASYLCGKCPKNRFCKTSGTLFKETWVCGFVHFARSEANLCWVQGCQVCSTKVAIQVWNNKFVLEHDDKFFILGELSL